MKLWDISGDGKVWKVQSDIRDLGGISILPKGPGLVPLSNRVVAVGALPLGFQVMLGLVRGKYIPAVLHAAEASYVSSSPFFPLSWMFGDVVFLLSWRKERVLG